MARRPRTRPTLEEVAALAGVGRGTASRVINGGAKVSDRARQAVEEAIAELGYVPNAAARALVTRRTDAVALVKNGCVAVAEGANMPTTPAAIRVFADAGYLVFAFDFSGQGHSDDSVSGDPGNNVEEAQDALTYLFAESPVKEVLDATRIGVVGHSQGAIATMALQAVEPRVKAAVAAAPISAQSAPFDANPIPVMIQTGDHDGPIAPIPFAETAGVLVVSNDYEELEALCDRVLVMRRGRLVQSLEGADKTHHEILVAAAS